MGKRRKLLGQELVRILCNKFGFQVGGRSGSHVRLSKMTGNGKIGCVVPIHPELRLGTLKSILRQTQLTEEQVFDS